MDNKNGVFEHCFELGQVYAQKTGFILSSLKRGFYNILDDIEKDTEELKKKRDNKISETNEIISKQKTEKDFLEKEIKELDKRISTLGTENNKIIHDIKEKRISCNKDIKDKDRRISFYKDKLKLGSTARQRSKFEFNFVKIVFWVSSISLVIIYWFFWYKGLFSSNLDEIIKEKGIAGAVIDPKFIATAFTNGNYMGLVASILLTAFPLMLSYLFHSNLKVKDLKSVITTYGALLLALILDVLLAYRIVEHVFSYKKFLGEVENVNFSLSYCLHEVSFFLIFFISFFAYVVWGFFFMKYKFMKQPDEEIEKTINSLAEEKNKLLKDLDGFDLSIKNQEEKKKTEKENFENQKTINKTKFDNLTTELDANKKILDDIDLKPITSEFDLRRRSNSFFDGFIKMYKDKSERGKSDKEIDEEINKMESIIDDFINEVKASGRFFFI